MQEMLLELQKDKSLQDLSYDVRLFVPDPSEPGVGEGLEELVTPARTAAPEADAFLTPGRSHLFPKLAYAVYPISGFVECHERYSAHVSILFDLFTIDRHLGIEYFDHNRTGERPDYLIDHSNDLALNAGRRMVVTSRSLTEVRLLVRSLLKDYDLDLTPERASGVLDQLRSLSGKLALKLIGSQSQRAEVLGLSLARLFLEKQGAFSNQIVVPLDSHLEFYREIRENADWKADEITLKRTDLALVDLNLESREVTFRLVEVKCFGDTGGLASINRLRSSIAEQIEQSARVLGYHFDPANQSPDRPDRVVKTRQLVELLSFYLERSCRFEIIEEEVAQEFRACLHALESGYTLRFTKSGLIFDLGGKQEQAVETDEGIEFFHLGRPVIESLLQSLSPPTGSSTSMGLEEDSSLSDTDEERSVPMERASITPLATAAFIAPPRDHTKLLDLTSTIDLKPPLAASSGAMSNEAAAQRDVTTARTVDSPKVDGGF